MVIVIDSEDSKENEDGQNNSFILPQVLLQDGNSVSRFNISKHKRSGRRSSDSWQTKRQDARLNNGDYKACHKQPKYSKPCKGSSYDSHAYNWRSQRGRITASTSQVNRSTPEESHNHRRVSQRWRSRTKDATLGFEADSWRNQGAGASVSTMRESQSTSYDLCNNQGSGSRKNEFSRTNCPQHLTAHDSRGSQACNWRSQRVSVTASTSQVNQSTPLKSYNPGKVSQSWRSRSKGVSLEFRADSWRNQEAGASVSAIQESQSTYDDLCNNQGSRGQKNGFSRTDSPQHFTAHESHGSQACNWRIQKGRVKASTSQVNQSTPEESHNPRRVNQSWPSRTIDATLGFRADSWRNQEAGATISTLRDSLSTYDESCKNHGSGGTKNVVSKTENPQHLNSHLVKAASRESQAYSLNYQRANAIGSTLQENRQCNEGYSSQYQSGIPLPLSHHDDRSFQSFSTSSFCSRQSDMDSDSSSSASSSSESLTKRHETPIRMPEPTSAAILEAVDYTDQDTIFFKYMKIIYSFGRYVMNLVFREETKDRPHDMPLLTYFTENKVKVEVLKKCLNDQQLLKIQNDPEGKTFDISLLFLCIQFWCNRSRDGKNEPWKESNDSLESLLTTLKNKRNELIHDGFEFDKGKFSLNIKSLQELLSKILLCAEKRYNIPKDHVRKVRNHLERSIKYLWDYPLKSHFTEHNGQNDLLKYQKYAKAIRNTLEELWAKSELDISKFQDLPTETAEFLCFEKLGVCENTKLKILESIRATIIRKRDHWLTFLAAVKYDKFVVTFVSREADIFRGHIRISDTTVLAYISLFRELRAPVSGVILSISIDKMSKKNDLLKEINKNKLPVMNLRLHEEFRKPEVRVIEEDVLNEILERGAVSKYVGAFTENMQLPPTIISLKVGIASEDACDHLNKYLTSYKGGLSLCLPKPGDSVSLKPILTKEHLPVLYIPDVACVKEAVDRVMKLQSVGDKPLKLRKLLFPRCSLHVQDIEDLIMELQKKKVHVCSYLSFPKCMKPFSNDDVNALQEKVKTALSCHAGIIWKHGNFEAWEK